MAKQKGPQSVQNRHIYTRASYLYQAAQYLASQQTSPKSSLGDDPQHSTATEKDNGPSQKATQNLSRQMLTDMRVVTQKILIRQSPDLKRTICKFCDTLQVEGQTSSSQIENSSRGAKKPWADVLATRCLTCNHVKRFPISAQRQKRRPLREAEEKADDMAVDSIT
ncbi:RNAse P rpr2/Rpp21/SNM1 subunit domain-containing protein [Sarocladium implicatum]|nr:RNAse P rpr2/Rpp21/SNM1 subunit domain-containing protein [Sarocladium implicatum]